ncbi:uncharacterized protein METZ01_LOCUS236931 [marine metagenome]|uniref:DUF1207 domain-containing protein n=1 Tax=marine metagenome TaxID=408172 RepID=A0A382HAY9_9ZZZZ
MINSERMKDGFYITFFLMVIPLVFTADLNAADLRFAPRGRLFQPLLADPTEPRFALVSHLNNNRLEGTIGGSWEAFDVAWNNGVLLRSGMHAGVFTQLRKSGATFPLETTDFMFAWHTDLRHHRFTGRFEFAHISAHIADGFNDPARTPITYSREFLALYGDYRWPPLRLYSSLRVSNHAIPDIKRWRVQFGGELNSGLLLGRNPRLYAAYDVRIFDNSGTVVNQTGQMGVMFHTSERNGFRIALVGHTGRSEHGQFHDLSDHYVGLGVFFDM